MKTTNRTSARRLLTTATLVLAAAGWLPAKTYTVSSPDRKITVAVDQADRSAAITYAVERDGVKLLLPSEVGMNIAGSDAPIYIKGARTRNAVAEAIAAPLYRQSSFEVAYNELDLTLSGGLGLTFRVYDDGVAYRFRTSAKGEVVVNAETARFRFPADLTAFLPYTTGDRDPFAMAFQNFYDETALSHAADRLAFLPATVDYGNGLKLTIAESNLEAYPGMFVKADTTALALDAVFAPYPASTGYWPWRKQLYVVGREPFIARTEGARAYPWRVLAITTDDRQLPVNNLVYALAEPSRLADTSWIRTGKVAWDWWNNWGLRGVPFKAGINTATYKHYIDFASDNGLEFVVLDEGWYEPKSGDMLTVVPDIDLRELIDYADRRGVGIVLWTVFNVLDDQLEEACSRYADMGVVGFKVDFLDRNDQAAVEMAYRIADACARHHLILDYHGFYPPTGLNRTYPNVVNFEAVFGMEEVKWTDRKNDMPRYDVTFPYIRMLAGPVDYTPGAMRNATRSDWRAVYNNPMSMGTRCHQLAAYVVHDSPFTMLCDAPTNYRGEEEAVDFIAGLPVVFDQTSILAGEMAKYIVTARRAGGSWYIGGMTNWDGRDVEIDFSFLPQGATYKATAMLDGINADKDARDYRREVFTVTAADRLTIHMAGGGGMAMRLDPVPPGHSAVTAVPAEKRPAIPDFYQKYIATDGFYIVSSERVSDEALELACDIVGYMLLKRPDVKQHMVQRGAHLMVIGKDEQTCDIPEYHHVCTDDSAQIAYINWRARGFGGAPEDELSSSCGEENLLALPSDKYVGENILVHEFAHLIHTVGIVGVEPDFDQRLTAVYDHAKAAGLWDVTYALSNKEEYFAECVQSFFNCNPYVEPANGIHNHVNNRVKLKAYDPMMYRLLSEYFYEIEIPIRNKTRR